MTTRDLTAKALGFFSFLPAKPKFKFTKISRLTLPLSVLVLFACAFLLFTKGLNYGVDFKGGTQVHLKFSDNVDSAQVRSALQTVGFEDAFVQKFGEEGNNEFLLRIAPQDLNLEEHVAAFTTAFAPSKPKVRLGQERFYISNIANDAVNETSIASTINALNLEGISVESVTPYGGLDQKEWMVQLSGTSSRAIKAIQSSMGADKTEVLQVEQVGAKVGKELRQKAVASVLIAICIILLYIWFRFDLEFAPGAILALVHDAMLVLGLFALFQLQFDLSIVAAVLTIVGFSINDTIVVYDRVRENLQQTKQFNFEEIINKSLNETLSRTLLTSGTLFLAAIALWFFGGPITENFALSFTIGVLVGTYSTIFIASPLTIWFYRYLSNRKLAGNKQRKAA